MSKSVIVIGAGMGGLAASLRLARQGFRVRVLEARLLAGGLASSIQIEGFHFDAGPYILLDRNGLEWAFRAVDLELADLVPLTRLEDIYQVNWPDGTCVRFHHDLETTAAGFEGQWPGSGARYVDFVKCCTRRYDALRGLLYKSHPGPCDLLRSPALWQSLFLASSLGRVLRGARLPAAISDAIAIWTHIAGQDLNEAPSVMAFVPAMFHTVGAYYPDGGIGAIPAALASAAASAGVDFSYGTSVSRIRSNGDRITGVETTAGEFLVADAVVSNSGGVGTYIDLLPETPRSSKQKLESLPLQSPGVIAYLKVKVAGDPLYLRFRIPANGAPCRLLAIPSLPAADRDGDDRNGWRPARLIVPMSHYSAQSTGLSGQREYLDGILAEDWWKDLVSDFRVLATRTPSEWGVEFNLYRESMNPVMTASFMRQGRLAHRSPWFKGLYLAGSATHPGQWVSFCAISGILAADQLCEDLL